MMSKQNSQQLENDGEGNRNGGKQQKRCLVRRRRTGNKAVGPDYRSDIKVTFST